MPTSPPSTSDGRHGRPVASGSFGIGRGGFSAAAAVAWAVVGIPIVWGIGITLSKAFILFR